MKKTKVGIIGLGYVGLALTRALCKSDIEVVGIDTNLERVQQMRSGISPNESISNEEIKYFTRQSLLQISTLPEDIRDCDVVIIAVPTPLDKFGQPDYLPLKSACESVGEYLKPKALLINESTSHPGTLRDFIIPIIRSKRADHGKDLLFACSPERVNPGDNSHGLRNTPRVVSGLGDEAKSAVKSFYSTFVEHVHLADTPEIAEMSKLLENAFRLVNIAFINELNDYCHVKGIALRDVIEAASTKPFGFMAFKPGPGIGGHCIPVDPEYLLKDAEGIGLDLEILKSAALSNRDRPQRILEFIGTNFGDMRNSRILLEGVTYKSNIADIRESPTIQLLERMKSEGFTLVKWRDPLIKSLESFEKGFPEKETFDLILLMVTHNQSDLESLQRTGAKIVDFTDSFVPDGKTIFSF